MIVKNEAANLPQALESVRAWVDQIVVVDTGSSDDTRAVAQTWGCEVFDFPWQDDFAAARNFSIAQATGDWVLVLDGDEVVVPSIVRPMQQVIHNPQALVVTLTRQEVGLRQAPYSQVARLFRRHPHIQFYRPYHELIDESIAQICLAQPDWQILSLAAAPNDPVGIQHFGYTREAIAQNHKTERAQRIMTQWLTQHPEDAYIANKLGALLIGLGQLESGTQLLQQALDQTPPAEAMLHYELHYHLAQAKLAQLVSSPEEDPHLWVSEAIAHYQAALALPVPPLTKLTSYHNLGNLALDYNRPVQAHDLYQQVVAIAPQFALGYDHLGKAKRALGDLSGAVAAYEQAITLDPDYAPAHQNRGVALFKLGQVHPAMDAWQRAIALYAQQGDPAGDHLAKTLRDMGLL